MPPAQKEKAGATALFEDPERKSTNVGVVVNPVRITSLKDFGTLEFVAGKLLAAETRKVRPLLASQPKQCVVFCSKIRYWSRALPPLPTFEALASAWLLKSQPPRRQCRNSSHPYPRKWRSMFSPL